MNISNFNYYRLNKKLNCDFLMFEQIKIRKFLILIKLESLIY